MFDAECHYDFTNFMSELEARVYDPALLNQLKARFPNLVDIAHQIVASERRFEPSKPLPQVGEWTAGQVAVFDNWLAGPTGRTRYVLAIEAWTAPAGKIQTHKKENYQAKAMAQLVTAEAMKKKLAKPSKSLSASFVADLKGVVADMGADDLIGLIYTQGYGEGTRYHDGQFVLVSGGVQGEDTFVIVSTDGAVLAMPKFSPTQPGGKTKHSGKVILQSRLDVAGFSETWATDAHG